MLGRDHPALLIEAENRHRPSAVESVRQYLAQFDYHGFMLSDGRLVGIEHFDPAKDQNVRASDLQALNADNIAVDM